MNQYESRGTQKSRQIKMPARTHRFPTVRNPYHVERLGTSRMTLVDWSPRTPLWFQNLRVETSVVVRSAREQSHATFDSIDHKIIVHSSLRTSLCHEHSAAALHLHSWTDYFRSKATTKKPCKKPWIVWHDIEEGVLVCYCNRASIHLSMSGHMDPFLTCFRYAEKD